MKEDIERYVLRQRNLTAAFREMADRPANEPIALALRALADAHEGVAAELAAIVARHEPGAVPEPWSPSVRRAVAEALDLELCPACEEPLGPMDRMEEPCASCQQDAGDRAYDAYRDREVA